MAPPSHRRILGEYSPYLLDQMIAVVTASTLMGYALYTVAPETVARFGTDWLALTMPFPLYGIFRYLYLVHQPKRGGSPTDDAAHRPAFAALRGTVGCAVVLIIYRPLLP